MANNIISDVLGYRLSSNSIKMKIAYLEIIIIALIAKILKKKLT